MRNLRSVIRAVMLNLTSMSITLSKVRTLCCSKHTVCFESAKVAENYFLCATSISPALFVVAPSIYIQHRFFFVLFWNVSSD